MTKIFNAFLIVITIFHLSLIAPVIKAEVVETIPVGVPAYRIAITPDGLKALVTSPGPNTLTMIDLDTNSILDTLELPGSANAGLEIAITNDGNKALITNYTDKTLIVVDINSVSVEGEPIPIGVSASGITALSDNRTLLMPNEGNCGNNLHCLSVFKTDTPGNWLNISLAENIPVNRGPRMAAVLPDDNTILVPNGGLSGEGTTVEVIEPADKNEWATGYVSNTIGVGGQPTRIAISPNGMTALVTNANDGTISVIESSSINSWATASVTNTISFEGNPTGIALTPDGLKVLFCVGNFGVVRIIRVNSMDEWSTAAYTGEAIPLSGTPNLISITPNGKKAIVTQFNAGTVSILTLEPAIACVTTAGELQTALTQAAGNGRDDIIQIAQGTYNGNFVYTSMEPYGLTMEGGYNSDCTARMINPANTLFDANGTGRVLTFDCSGVAANLDLSGITIKNGNMIEGHGGGIFAKTSGGSFTVTKSIITNNSANSLGSSSIHGGGIYSEGMNTVTIQTNIINENFAWGSPWNFGGGIGVQFSNIAIIKDNILNDNKAIRGGGGVFLHALNTIKIEGNKISGNYVDNHAQGGAGIHINTINTSTMVNNVIRNNRTWGYGGGVHIFDSKTVNVINNTISENEARDGGGIWLYLREDSDIAFIYNNIVWANSDFGAGIGRDLYINNNGNSNDVSSVVNLFNNDFDLTNGFFIEVDDASVTYSDNLDNIDPIFDIDGYHLTKNSPCIDAGVDAGVYDDIDGDSRPQGAGYDIGADEYVSLISIDSILGYFDESIADGTIYGIGKVSRIANLKLWLFRLTLETAKFFIEKDEIEYACKALNRAFLRCDGDPRPIDFIEGVTVPELAEMILELMDELGCE